MEIENRGFELVINGAIESKEDAEMVREELKNGHFKSVVFVGTPGSPFNNSNSNDETYSLSQFFEEIRMDSSNSDFGFNQFGNTGLGSVNTVELRGYSSVVPKEDQENGIYKDYEYDKFFHNMQSLFPNLGKLTLSHQDEGHREILEALYRNLELNNYQFSNSQKSNFTLEINGHSGYINPLYDIAVVIKNHMPKNFSDLVKAYNNREKILLELENINENDNASLELKNLINSELRVGFHKDVYYGLQGGEDKRIKEKLKEAWDSQDIINDLRDNVLLEKDISSYKSALSNLKIFIKALADTDSEAAQKIVFSIFRNNYDREHEFVKTNFPEWITEKKIELESSKGTDGAIDSIITLMEPEYHFAKKINVSSASVFQEEINNNIAEFSCVFASTIQNLPYLEEVVVDTNIDLSLLGLSAILDSLESGKLKKFEFHDYCIAQNEFYRIKQDPNLKNNVTQKRKTLQQYLEEELISSTNSPKEKEAQANFDLFEECKARLSKLKSEIQKKLQLDSLEEISQTIEGLDIGNDDVNPVGLDGKAEEE